MVESGTVLAGRYRLDKQLGKGGMGEVWQARDLTYERGLNLAFDVAVKVMRSTPGSEMLRRFEQEAAILRRLRHPNIVRMLDADLHEGQPGDRRDDEDGERRAHEPVFVMTVTGE